MAINRLPPRLDENNLKESIRQMNEYMFYLREQTQYELDLINKRMGVLTDGENHKR